MMDFWIYGINPVHEALQSDRCQVREVWVAEGRGFKGLEKIVGTAQSRGVSLRKVERARLDSLTKNIAHQGVVGFIDHWAYADLDEILPGRGGEPLLLILDGIEDPRNLGALIRTADASGVWGVIIPKDRAVGITPAVVKSSAGAIFHVPVVRVTNIAATVRTIKEKGIWVAGADAEARGELYQQDLTPPLAVLIGGEGRGIRQLVRKECDFLLSIPMRGKVNSLNASSAAAIILYEVLRQRGFNHHQ